MRYSLLLALLVCAVGVQAIPQERDTSSAPQKTAARKIPCKTTENASMCYWTHGRLGFANGDPSYRLWKIGTKRILAIYSGPAVMQNSAVRAGKDGENPEFPANIDKIYGLEYKRRASAGDPTPDDPDPIYADLEVCPLEPERPGWMQAACIESAKHIVVERWFPIHNATFTYPDTY